MTYASALYLQSSVIRRHHAPSRMPLAETRLSQPSSTRSLYPSCIHVRLGFPLNRLGESSKDVAGRFLHPCMPTWEHTWTGNILSFIFPFISSSSIVCPRIILMNLFCVTMMHASSPACRPAPRSRARRSRSTTAAWSAARSSGASTATGAGRLSCDDPMRTLAGWSSGFYSWCNGLKVLQYTKNGCNR